MDYEHFVSRLNAHYDELKWLYCELYNNDMMAFHYFVDMLRRCFEDRKQALRQQDQRRLENPDWYRSNRMLGMMLYVDNFAGNLRGVRERLPYLKECGVNYLHLMPLLDTVPGRSDGGYAVADFRKVRPDLGTMADLEALADDCRAAGISLALDFVMNHTSEDHAWAKAARAGDPVARARYFFYKNWDVPNEFEKTVPQVFPTTAPGNFTYLEDCDQIVMTSFYPYQWDLNYANPMVFNDMTENLLWLTNRGMDVIRLDAIPYIWKEIGTAVLCGTALALVCFGKVMLVDRLLLGNGDVTVMVAAVVCITMALTVLVAKVVGCTLPMFAKRLGFDPAVMASPFITTIVDALSLLVYFGIATALLGL